MDDAPPSNFEASTSPSPSPPSHLSSTTKHVQFGSTTMSDANKDDDRGKSSESDVNEASPLLAARSSEDGSSVPTLSGVASPASSDTAWAESGEDKEETRSSWYLFLLTLSIGGLQIAWSVELSNGSPYLLSLGISKSLLAIVWIAGPLSGTLVQPYIGIKSDRCRSRFGKRRPFMVGGAAATIVSLLALAWAKEIIAAILDIFGLPKDSKAVTTTTIVFAVVMIYVLDFAINVIQAGIRAFIVDNAPTHQQDSANAWASRVTGIGSIVGYLFGYTNLPQYLWFFGNTQFKDLCVIASLALIVTLTISCLAISERDPRLEGEPSYQKPGILAFFKSLFRSIRKLPPQIKAVCRVQFFAWIGWFPFLFYTTTYIAEIYAKPILKANPAMTKEEIALVWEHGTRVGTFALLIFAITTFASSVILPFFVASSYQAPRPVERTAMTPTYVVVYGEEGGASGGPCWGDHGEGGLSVSQVEQPQLYQQRALQADDEAMVGDEESLRVIVSQPEQKSPSLSHQPIIHGPASRTPTAQASEAATSAADYFGHQPAADMLSLKSKASFSERFPCSLEIPWLTLRRTWMLSHVLFFVLTWLTFLARTTTTATILVACIGIPWSVACWAPFALIAAEIRKRDAIRRGLLRPHSSPTASRDDELLARGEDDSEGADQAGTVLGIHNVAIAAPQVIATLFSSVIFYVLAVQGRGQAKGDLREDDSVGWVLRIGAVAALWAFHRCKEVGEEGVGVGE